MFRSSPSSSSSSASSSSFASLGSLPPSVRFDGTASKFPDWKFNMLALLRMHKLHEQVLQPRPRKRAPAAGGMGAEAQEQEQDRDAEEAAAEIQSAADQLWEERADRAFGMLV